MSVYDEYIDLPEQAVEADDDLPEGTLAFEATVGEMRALDESTLAFVVQWLGQLSHGLQDQVMANFQLDGVTAEELIAGGDPQALQATGTVIGFGMAFQELHALATRFAQLTMSDRLIEAFRQAAEKAGEEFPDDVTATDDEVAYTTQLWLGRAETPDEAGVTVKVVER